jgi:hypothetical protein
LKALPLQLDEADMAAIAALTATSGWPTRRHRAGLGLTPPGHFAAFAAPFRRRNSTLFTPYRLGALNCPTAS